MEYYIKLFELFAKSTGRKIKKENYAKVYDVLKNEFLEWLYIYKKMTFEYRQYLEQYYNINLDTSEVAELGKCNLDSVVRDDAVMITPYGHSFTDLYHKDSKLIVTEKDIKIDFGYCVENAIGINLYITQNPYLYTNVISDLKKLSDYHKKNIILGMYGKVYDSDRKGKIKILKQFKSGLDNNNQFELDYNTSRDNYFCTITRK